MKNNKIIIYDDSCPLCAAYTKAFVAAGMIQKENRKDFSTAEPALLKLIDLKRCPNEIPMIDIETKTVFYGVDAITEILEEKFPWIKKSMKISFGRWAAEKLYKLISYNRRVIVAAKNSTIGFDCTPDLNYKYRIIFMLLFLAFNTVMLFPLRSYVLSNSGILISATQLQAAHFSVVGINVIIALAIKKKVAIEYLGQINMLALITILLSTPLILLNKYEWLQEPAVNNACLLLLSAFVCIEYKRRMDFAAITSEYPVIVLVNMVSAISFVIYLLN